MLACLLTLFGHLPAARSEPTAPPPSQATEPAKDDQREQARASYKKAEALYRLGDFQQALESYKRVFLFSQAPEVAFNIAQCYRQSQRPEQAIFYYKLFLSDWSRKNPNKQSPFRKEVEGHIHQLTQEIKAKKEQARLKQQRLEAAKKLKRASDEANALLSLEKERRRKAIWAYSSLGLALACAGTAAALYGIGFDAGNAANEEYLSSKSQQEMDGHYADVEKAKDMLVAGHVLAGV